MTDLILFYNEEFCSPYIFCSKVKIPNKKNKLLWAINRKDYIWCFDNETQQFLWIYKPEALTCQNPIYYEGRLKYCFERREEALSFLKKSLESKQDMDLPELFDSFYENIFPNISNRNKILNGEF